MARDAFRWREPWRASMARKPPFNPVSREVLFAFGTWLVAFAGLGVIARWNQVTTFAQLRDIAGWMVGLAAVLALFVHAIEWLSPRSFCSGPKGIVISRTEVLMVLPWEWIAGFEFRESARPPELRLHFVDGSSHDLMLSPKADRAAIAAELRRRVDSQVRA